MLNHKVLFFIFPTLMMIQLSYSQNNTNSPYTRFGYGEINDNHNGEQRAMGGVAMGVRSSASINSVNPASYSVVDSMTFMFDMGASLLVSNFSSGNNKKTTFTGNLDYLTIQFPLAKKIGVSAGIQPYSFSGYNFSENQLLLLANNTDTPDSVTATKSFVGSGGFSEFYAGLSFELFHHLSLGVNAYYMFGSINNYRNISFDQSTNFTPTTQLNYIEANNFRFRYGGQFFTTFAKKHEITLGLIYEQKKNFNGNASTIISGISVDTINYDLAFDLPTIFGAGLYYTYHNKLSVGFDYSFQNWKEARFYGKTDTLANRHKIAIGGEYIPDANGRKYFEHIRYRVGFNMSNPYYKIEGISPGKNFGINFGVGLPLRYSRTIINASFEYGKIGNYSKLKENYFKFTFNACINENWFFKRKL